MAGNKRIGWTVGARVWIRDGGACSYCGSDLSLNPKDPLYATIDHVTPVANGGSSDEWNLALACAPCNSGKEVGKVPSIRVRDVRDRLARLYPARGASPRSVPRDKAGGPQRPTTQLGQLPGAGENLRELRRALAARSQFREDWAP